MDLMNIFGPIDNSADVICADCTDRFQQIKNQYLYTVTALSRELHYAYTILKTYEIEIERMKSTQADLEMKVYLLSLGKQPEENKQEENSNRLIENTNGEGESVSETDEEIEIESVNGNDMKNDTESNVPDHATELEDLVDDTQPSPAPVDVTEDSPDPTAAETPKSYVCTVCQSSFKFVIELNRHLYYFSLKWYLKNSYSPLGYHLGGLRSLMCHVKNCGMVLQTTTELEKHMREHMAQPYECTKCGAAFSCYDTDACKHESNCIRNKPYKCASSSCSKTFFSKRTYSRHYNSIHAGIGSYECLVSNSDGTFTDSKELGQHSEYHSTENQYQCDKCEKSFKTERCLNYHLNTHRQTAIVREGAGSSSAFKQVTGPENQEPHVENSEEEKLIQSDHHNQPSLKIKCEQPGCSKEYMHKRDLKRHFFNSHVCRSLLECRQQTCRKIHLDTSPEWHSASYARDRPYECRICTRKFVLETSLRRHIKRVHANSISVTCRSPKMPETFTPTQDLQQPRMTIHSETRETPKTIFEPHRMGGAEEIIRRKDSARSFSAFHKPISRSLSKDIAIECDISRLNISAAVDPSEENNSNNSTDEISFMKGVELQRHTASL